MPDTRCTCGARTFLKRDLVITRSDGSVLTVNTMFHLTCVRCEREWFYDIKGPGSIEMREIIHTPQADKEIMKKAISEHRNQDGDEPYSFAAISEQDWKGYEEVRPK